MVITKKSKTKNFLTTTLVVGNVQIGVNMNNLFVLVYETVVENYRCKLC